ncbi:TonB-dependent receptor [Parasphingorhabdus sp.]|uniref:TonB-dependent receptor n=1 Tax=Parasphingorhabdus sp. TaxID=2709688 RepID=UPI003A92D72C
MANLNMKCGVSILVLTMAAYAGPALAQDVPDSDAIAAQDKGPRFGDDEIVVTATRTNLPISALPLTVDVIGSEELAGQLAITGSISDAVSALSPSFSPTRQKATSYGESLRGRTPLYSINGVPQSTPTRDSSRESYTIDPFFIERIELIYGSNSLQGIGATGGVVNQVTVGAPQQDGISGRVLLQGTAGNGFDGEGLSGKVGGLVSYRGGDLDVTAGATFERRGIFFDGHDNRIGADGAQGDLQDSDSYSFFTRLGYQISDSTRIELIANHLRLEGNGNYIRVDGDRQSSTPSTSVRGEMEGETASNNTSLLSVQLVDDDLAGGILTLQGFFNRSHYVFGGGVFATFQDPSIDPTGNLFEQSVNRSRKLGGKATYEREFAKDLTVTVGFDALFDNTQQDLLQTDRTWVPEIAFRSMAPFGQVNLGLFDRLVTVVGGARWENVTLDIDDYTTIASYGGFDVSGGSPAFDEILPNAGLVIEPLKGIRAYASYSKGYTVPDVGRVIRAVDEAGIDLDNFLDLAPVVSNNRELGVNVKRGPLDASASYFWSSSKLGQRLVANADGISEVTRERTEIEGFEINLGVETPVPGLRLGVGFADTTGRVDTDGDGVVDADLDGINISPSRMNLSANYDSGPFTAYLQGQFYLPRKYDGQPSSEDFEGYEIVNALVRYQTDYGAFTLAAQNIFNKFYVTYYSDTAQSTSNSNYYTGRGRTITASWDWRF